MSRPRSSNTHRKWKEVDEEMNKDCVLKGDIWASVDQILNGWAWERARGGWGCHHAYNSSLKKTKKKQPDFLFRYLCWMPSQHSCTSQIPCLGPGVPLSCIFQCFPWSKTPTWCNPSTTHCGAWKQHFSANGKMVKLKGQALLTLVRENTYRSCNSYSS